MSNTVVTDVTGTSGGELVFRRQGELIVISAFWHAALVARQIGLG